MITFYLRPKIKLSGRIRVIGWNINIYTENLEMIKLTKIRWRRKKGDVIQSKTMIAIL